MPASAQPPGFPDPATLPDPVPSSTLPVAPDVEGWRDLPIWTPSRAESDDEDRGCTEFRAFIRGGEGLVDLYEAPDASSSKVGGLYRADAGAEVRLIGRKGDFFEVNRVSFHGNWAPTKAWVKAEDVGVGAETCVALSGLRDFTVRLLKAPKLGAETDTMLPPQTLDLLGCEGDFLRVRSRRQGRTGWLYRKQSCGNPVSMCIQTCKEWSDHYPPDELGYNY